MEILESSVTTYTKSSNFRTIFLTTRNFYVLTAKFNDVGSLSVYITKNISSTYSKYCRRNLVGGKGNAFMKIDGRSCENSVLQLL